MTTKFKCLDESGNIIFNVDTSGTSINTSISSINSSTGSFVCYGGTSINNTSNATSITQGGALTIAGGVAVQKDMIIGGNLTVFGSQTQLVSQNVQIQDNLIVVNSNSVIGKDSGILFQRFQLENNSGLGDLIIDTPVFTGIISGSTISTIVSNGIPNNNTFIGSFVKIVSGSGINQVRKITNFDYTSKTLTLNTNWNTVPSVNDTFSIYNKCFGIMYYNETSNAFTLGWTSSDNNTIVLSDYATLDTGSITIHNTNDNSLTVAGGIMISKSLNANWNSNTIGNIYTTGGNIGINTTSPLFNFDVAGTGNFTRIIGSFSTMTNLLSNNITCGSAFINNIISTNTSFGSLISSNINSTNINSTNVSSSNINSSNINSSNINSTNVSSSNINSSNITASNVNFTNVSTANISSSNITALNVNFTNISTSNIISTNVNFTNVSTSNIIASNVNFTNITTTNLLSTNLLSTNSTITNLLLTNSTITNLLSTNSTITNLLSTNSTITNLLSTNLLSTNSTITNLLSTNLLTTNSTTSSAHITNLIVGNLNSSNSNTIGNLFTTSGNIGINNTSPGYQLDVNGDIRASNLILSSTLSSTLSMSGGITILNSTDAVSITNGGSFMTYGGISIQKSLFVGQDVNISGSLYINNSKINSIFGNTTIGSYSGSGVYTTVITIGKTMSNTLYNIYGNLKTTSNISNVYTVSFKNITTTTFDAIIYRIDSLGSGWTDTNLQLSWIIN